jgi:hypothetical protein
VQRLDDVEDVLQKLKKFLTHITIAKDDEGRLEIILSGVNLHIVNGLGRTDCGEPDTPVPDCPNGLGNLIVGYNEPRGFGEDIRTGSHNVVVGQEHNFSRFGGWWSAGLTPSVGTSPLLVGGGQHSQRHLLFGEWRGVQRPGPRGGKQGHRQLRISQRRDHELS